MDAYLRAGARVEGLRRTLRRQVRAASQDPVQHQGARRRLRRRADVVAHPHGSRRRGDRQVPCQRERGADHSELPRHRRRRFVRGRNHAHRTLGSRPGPDRQARRDHRHGCLRCPGHPRDRANCGAAHGLSAHTHLVLPEARRASVAHDPAVDAAPRRPHGAAVAEPGLRRAHVHAARAVLHPQSDGQEHVEGRRGVSAQAGPRPGGARQAHAALRRRLQAARFPQHLSVNVQPRQRRVGDRADRQDHRLRCGNRRR